MALIQVNPLTEQIIIRPNEADLELVDDAPTQKYESLSMFYLDREIEIYFSVDSGTSEGHCQILNTLPISFCGEIFIKFNLSDISDINFHKYFTKSLTENILFNT